MGSEGVPSHCGAEQAQNGGTLPAVGWSGLRGGFPSRCGVERAQNSGRRGQAVSLWGPSRSGSHTALSQHLEQSLGTLHLSSFGLMDTTLEEVFLKVSEEDQSLENSEAGERSQSCSSVLPLSTPTPSPGPQLGLGLLTLPLSRDQGLWVGTRGHDSLPG